ncbi:MAG: hypothetical protein ACR2HJ_12705 [Fimbriimonadales bacterium]
MARLLSGDSDGVYNLLSRAEVDNLQLTRERLRRYVTEYLEPRIAGFKADGGPRVDTTPSSGTVTVDQMMKHSDGRAFLLTLQASPVGRQDAQLNAFVANTYLSVHWSKLAPGQSIPPARERRKAWIETAKADRGQLESIGIPGFLGVNNDYRTWGDWIEHNEEALGPNVGFGKGVPIR